MNDILLCVGIFPMQIWLPAPVMICHRPATSKATNQSRADNTILGFGNRVAPHLRICAFAPKRLTVRGSLKRR
jgi:hypothetical protein